MLSSNKAHRRLILVTGAGSGIGAEVAARFARDGAAVAVADLNLSAATHVADEISLDEGLGKAFCVDVGDPGSVADLVDAVTDWGGDLSVLVNCAGVNSHHDVLDLPFEEWERVLRINLTGTFLMSQVVARTMAPLGRGCIVNISSVAAEVAVGDAVHYAASKGGVRQLTKGLAVALTPYNIRVNAVGPGPVITNLTKERVADPEVRDLMMRGILRGRLGRPADIASAVTFLASDDADFITGTTLYPDGGILACR